MLIMINDVNSHALRPGPKFYKFNAFSLCAVVVLFFMFISWPIALFNTLGIYLNRSFFIGSKKIIINSMNMILYVQPWFKRTVKMKIVSPDTDRVVIYVSNHRSNLDVFAFMASLEGIRVVAKKALFKVPGLALGMRLFRQIRFEVIEGESVNSSLEVIYKAVKEGDRVLIFPEMTRCAYGFEGMQRFSSIPFQIARNIDALIVPIICCNTDNVWAKGIPGISFREPFKVFSIDPVDSRKFKTTREFREYTKKTMTKALMEKQKQFDIG